MPIICPPAVVQNAVDEFPAPLFKKMTAWSRTKTARRIDLIDRQIDWAGKQRNIDAPDYLEKFRLQIIEARCRKFDSE